MLKRDKTFGRKQSELINKDALEYELSLEQVQLLLHKLTQPWDLVGFVEVPALPSKETRSNKMNVEEE